MTQGEPRSAVLVGGKNPDEIYNNAAERTRKAREDEDTLERQRQEAERGRQDRQQGADGIGMDGGAAVKADGSRKPLFTIENIVPDGRNGYVFEGLETPMGRWDYLTLDANLAEHGEKKSWAQWQQLSKAKKDPDRARIMPARVRYWMMAAMYESRETWNKMLGARIAEVKAIFWDDMTRLCHHAEKITYLFPPPAQTGAMALVANFGWPNNHPFSHIEKAYFLNSNPVPVGVGDRARDLLKTLFNDPDPTHVRDVLRWIDLANGQDYKAYVMDANPPLIKSTHIAIGYIKPEERKLPAINTFITSDAELYCRYIRADPADFHARHPRGIGGGGQ